MFKKFSLCLMAIFTLVFSVLFMFPVKADIVSHGDYRSVSLLKSFNAIKGLYCDDENGYGHICWFVGKVVKNGEFTAELTGKINGVSHTLLESQKYQNEKLVEVEYWFDNELFYKVEIEDETLSNVILDKELNFSKEYGDYDATFIRDNEYVYSYINGNPLEQDEQISVNGYEFSYLMGITYSYNEKYKNNDLHAVMGYQNKLKIEDILSSLTLIDHSSSNYEIINNTYDYETSGIGTYSFEIVAWDDSQNVSLQKVIVDVVDLVAPKIIQTKAIRLSYKDKWEKEDFLSCFDIDDKDATVDIDISEYEKNVGIVGDYKGIITATDKSDYKNVSTLEFTISIIDNIPPVVCYPSIIKIEYDQELQLDDIKSKVSAKDDYDGSENIEIFDEDNYLDNQSKVGLYKFKAVAKDLNGNEASVSFYVRVEDTKAPVISIEKYVIAIEKGQQITKDAIVDLFTSLGYEIDGSCINSEAFDLDGLDGEYDLDIDLKDGRKEKGTITTEKLNSVSFIEPIKQESKSNLSLIIAISASMALLTSLCVMGAIVYKKRH